MKISDLTISKESPLFIYELIKAPDGGIGSISKEPIKTYYTYEHFCNELIRGLFDKLENNNSSKLYKRQMPYSYDEYVVFIDNKKSSKFNLKHEYMIQVPRLKNKCSEGA